MKTKLLFEHTLKRAKDGTISKVILWDDLIELINETGNFKKINGVMIDEESNVLTNDKIYEILYRNIKNLDNTNATHIVKRLLQSTENQDLKIDKKYIVLNNGKYNVYTGDFTEGKFISANKIPWDYESDADSELGKEIMNRYIGDNIGFDTQVFEATGLLMSQDKDYKLKKSIFANGDADYGKSFLFEDILAPAIGWENIGNIEFGEIDEQEIASMINKTAVYDSDMQKGMMSSKSISKFKKVVGDTRLKAKILYKDKFSFENYSTAWINCNGLPKIIDRGSGGSIETRIHVIQFTVNVKDKYNDPKISDKVEQKREEISKWIVKESLHALTNVLKRGKLTDTKESLKAKEMELVENDTVNRFLNIHEILGTHPIKLSDLYRAYEKSFTDYNYGDLKVGKNSFGRTLRDMSKTLGIKVFKSNGQIVIKKEIVEEI